MDANLPFDWRRPSIHNTNPLPQENRIVELFLKEFPDSSGELPAKGKKRAAKKEQPGTAPATTPRYRLLDAKARLYVEMISAPGWCEADLLAAQAQEACKIFRRVFARVWTAIPICDRARLLDYWRGEHNKLIAVRFKNRPIPLIQLVEGADATAPYYEISSATLVFPISLIESAWQVARLLAYVYCIADGSRFNLEMEIEEKVERPLYDWFDKTFRSGRESAQPTTGQDGDKARKRRSEVEEPTPEEEAAWNQKADELYGPYERLAEALLREKVRSWGIVDSADGPTAPDVVSFMSHI